MAREVLLEIGCEELPASWLPGLIRALGQHFAARLTEHRLTAATPVETYGTPRRLTLRIEKVADRQPDLEQTVVGPPVSAAFGSDGQPTPAAIGFARKNGVRVDDLLQVDTPKGRYLACTRRERSAAAIDVLPGVLAAVLRDLSFPRQMRWDAFLDDGRGELLFGRPIRWLLFLYGGRVVPFSILRTEGARSAKVAEIRSGAVTYGHRFLAVRGRPGKALKVRTFKGYRDKMSEHFVVLDAAERRDRITRQLALEAGRLGGLVGKLPSSVSGPLDEVPNLVEYPSVVAGTFPVEFLALPEEVLVTTMVRHQHFYPVAAPSGRLKPAFLAVTNSQPDGSRTIARNAERVLTARLRDAQFFWDADRARSLTARVDALETVLFHKRVGSYRAKADRVADLAEWIARVAFDRATAAELAGVAGRLAKADLTTQMVREFTELQGTMGGVYAREEGQPEEVWKAIYYHYLPVGVEAGADPAPEALGAGAVTWAAVSLADKLDTIVSLFGAGEQPTGSRDPFGLRRQAHGVLKVLVDLPMLAGVDAALSLADLVEAAAPGGGAAPAGLPEFFLDRVRHLFETRQFRYDEVNAVVGHEPTLALRPLDHLRRLDALLAARGSPDFEGLAVLLKRVKNIARESGAPSVDDEAWRTRLREPAERRLLEECDRRAPEIHEAVAQGSYRDAFATAAGLRPAVDRFFTDVFVMVEDERVRRDRLRLLAHVRDLILELADISEIVVEDV